MALGKSLRTVVLDRWTPAAAILLLATVALLSVPRRSSLEHVLYRLKSYCLEHHDDLQAATALAHVYALMGQTERAIEQHRINLDRFPGDAVNLYRLALLLVQLRRPASALKLLQEASDAEPGLSLYHLQLARLYCRTRQYPKARREWGLALETCSGGTGETEIIYLEIATALLRSNRLVEAREAIVAGLAGHPSSELLQDCLGKLAQFEEEQAVPYERERAHYPGAPEGAGVPEQLIEARPEFEEGP